MFRLWVRVRCGQCGGYELVDGSSLCSDSGCGLNEAVVSVVVSVVTVLVDSSCQCFDPGCGLDKLVSVVVTVLADGSG